MKKEKQMLRVRAVADILVQNYESMKNKPSIRRYVGRRWDAEAEEFVLLDTVVEVPNTKEYRDEIKAGHLEAADELTATLSGAPIVYHFV